MNDQELWDAIDLACEALLEAESRDDCASRKMWIGRLIGLMDERMERTTERRKKQTPEQLEMIAKLQQAMLSGTPASEIPTLFASLSS